MAGRHADTGSNLIEQVIAIGLIVVVLLGLLSALGAAAQGVTVGRQRTLAVSFAKQAIENLQGADYANVATDLSSPGLGSDPMVTGTVPNLYFEGERIVPGMTAPYTTTLTGAGTTFLIRTFVTSVTPPSGIGYRRITVFIAWQPTATGNRHTMRFSSLVFPLDYTTYPASSGSSEATGGLVTVVGHLGSDTFDDVHVSLAAARADTTASTLRTAIGSTVSSASHVDVQAGPISSTTCSTFGAGFDIGECARQVTDSIADNDATSTTGNWAADVGKLFVAGNLVTPGGLAVLTPAGTMASTASTDDCAACGFGDSDGVPWADTSVATNTVSSAAFSDDHGAGALTGQLWNLASGWSATATVDHDTIGGGVVTATARLVTPDLRVFAVEGAPPGFVGAVTVSGFTAAASAAAGHTLATPTVPSTPASVRIWDVAVAGYRDVTVTPGVAFDTSATGTFTVGDHVITFFSRIQSEPSTFSMVGSGPRTDAVAQHPSVLLVTVDVTISSLTTFTETDAFSVVVDYGRVSAHAAWLPRSG